MVTGSTVGAMAPGDRERCVLPGPAEMPVHIGYFGRGRRGPVRQLAVIRRDTVTIRRECESGIPLYISVPTGTYRGVVLAVEKGASGETLSLRLEHGNRDLAVPLLEAVAAEEAVEEWRAWSEALGRPLLIEDAEGCIHEADPRPAAIAVRPPRARRANSFFRERRPRFLTRRRVGGVAKGPLLREDEIIARGVDD